MILQCSRGCTHDTSQMWKANLKVGQRCPEVTSYDRLGGTTYCGRVLKRVDVQNYFAIDALRDFEVSADLGTFAMIWGQIQGQRCWEVFTEAHHSVLALWAYLDKRNRQHLIDYLNL